MGDRLIPRCSHCKHWVVFFGGVFSGSLFGPPFGLFSAFATLILLPGAGYADTEDWEELDGGGSVRPPAPLAACPPSQTDRDFWGPSPLANTQSPTDAKMHNAIRPHAFDNRVFTPNR